MQGTFTEAYRRYLPGIYCTRHFCDLCDTSETQTGTAVALAVLLVLYLHGLVKMPEADGVDDFQHPLVSGEGVGLLLENLVDPAPPPPPSNTTKDNNGW